MAVEGPLCSGIDSRVNMKIGVGGPVASVIHVFSECTRVQVVWGWFRGLLLPLLPAEASCLSSFELLHFLFPVGPWEATVCWLLSTYCEIVWNVLLNGGREVQLGMLRCELGVRYWEHHLAKRFPLIPLIF